LYVAALAIDSNNYHALWRASKADVDIAKQILQDNSYSNGVRDSVYEVAREYAERAIRADSMGAEGHYVLALALGRLSRTKGGKDRVRYARIIYDEASRALQLDSTLDGAEHILGAWHAEVKRLSGITKFFAKTFLGAGFMDRASWDSAVVHLKRAIALKPGYVFHHLELAEVYIDTQQYADARTQLYAVDSLPVTDVLDPVYKERADSLLAEIKDKQ
jgi:tetratricopeptide (TPR) repeat protein